MRTALFSFAIAIVACTATTGQDQNDKLDTPVGKADAASRPSGTYNNPTPHFGELSTLTLNADMTFDRTELVACPGGGTCAPGEQTGTYLFTHSDTGTHYIRFYDDAGNPLDRYQWQFAPGSSDLTLQLDGGIDGPFTMAHNSSCQDAGGSCVALSPGSCANGTVADATQYSCGGGLGVECCLPATNNQCTIDTDCTGLLPQFCRQCSDGSTSCAHWSCVENTCQITSCN